VVSVQDSSEHRKYEVIRLQPRAQRRSKVQELTERTAAIKNHSDLGRCTIDIARLISGFQLA
jgi:hypothetical protein